MSPVLLLALLVGIALALYLFSRANEIFCISVRSEKALLVRGRIPPTVFHAFSDIVQRSGVQKATIRAVAGTAHARLVVSGADEGTTQRLRNVFGNHPVQKLRGVKLPDARNVGQVLGIAWLAWLLTNRSS